MLTPSSKGPSASTAPAPFANRVSLISASLGFYRGQLVVALPGSVDLRRRTQPGLEGAVAGEPLELSVAPGELPCSFNRDLAAGRRDSALERAPVAINLAVDVNEVAPLGASAFDQIRDAPVGDRCVIPLLVWGLLGASDLGQVQLVVGLVRHGNGRLQSHFSRK